MKRRILAGLLALSLVVLLLPNFSSDTAAAESNTNDPQPWQTAFADLLRYGYAEGSEMPFMDVRDRYGETPDIPLLRNKFLLYDIGIGIPALFVLCEWGTAIYMFTFLGSLEQASRVWRPRGFFIPANPALTGVFQSGRFGAQYIYFDNDRVNRIVVTTNSYLPPFDVSEIHDAFLYGELYNPDNTEIPLPFPYYEVTEANITNVIFSDRFAAMPANQMPNAEITPYGRQVTENFLRQFPTIFQPRGWRNTQTGAFYVETYEFTVGFSDRWHIIPIDNWDGDIPRIFLGGTSDDGFSFIADGNIFDREGNMIDDIRSVQTARFINGNREVAYAWSFHLYNFVNNGIPDIVVIYNPIFGSHGNHGGWGGFFRIYRYTNGVFVGDQIYGSSRRYGLYLDGEGRIVSQSEAAGYVEGYASFYLVNFTDTGIDFIPQWNINFDQLTPATRLYNLEETIRASILARGFGDDVGDDVGDTSELRPLAVLGLTPILGP